MTRDNHAHTNPPPHVVMSREFKTTRGQMYSAWTNPEILQRWLHPGPEWSNPFAEIDLVVGGKYRIGFAHPDEKNIHTVGGRFIEIVPEKRLVYTWTWEPPHDDADIETLVTVEFFDSDEGTLVKLVHDRFPNQRLCQMHRDGWTETLGCLGSFVKHQCIQERN